MAVNKILFRELPFLPDRNQVFYIENGYDGVVNNFICSHYFDLKLLLSAKTSSLSYAYMHGHVSFEK